ncbi:MAG: (2Fe-2S)-binding protein [Anaerolineae bacterium]
MPHLTVITATDTHTLTARAGANLRRVLLDAGLSPYGSLSQHANCGGRGLCAPCGVWIEANAPDPTHWHDQAARLFGYPRLSCQISVDRDMTVRLIPDKIMWGQRDALRRGLDLDKDET